MSFEQYPYVESAKKMIPTENENLPDQETLPLELYRVSGINFSNESTSVWKRIFDEAMERLGSDPKDTLELIQNSLSLQKTLQVLTLNWRTSLEQAGNIDEAEEIKVSELAAVIDTLKFEAQQSLHQSRPTLH